MAAINTTYQLSEAKGVTFVKRATGFHQAGAPQWNFTISIWRSNKPLDKASLSDIRQKKLRITQLDFSSYMGPGTPDDFPIMLASGTLKTYPLGTTCGDPRDLTMVESYRDRHWIIDEDDWKRRLIRVGVPAEELS